MLVGAHICLRAIIQETRVARLFFLLEVKIVLAVKNEARRKMTRQEAGRKGGEKVSRERGPEFYRKIGKKGGEKVAEERGSEFYRAIGRKGGESRGNRIRTATRTKSSLGRHRKLGAGK